ncbi:MAG: hypothetical protein CL535_16485 [Ahrensia sp.]|nr:hypothetical protein [Ahrensia sp.]MBV48171.1 hypothetical protein [Roseobacter sp.]MBV48272.1 hypothetical protein [Roseobacter sp.]|tara:strand:- start:142020 stop:142226 length:207 start_codon:yes stop_codon:yes gene_type:complete
MKTLKDGWTKKFKGDERGGAWIYTHPDAFDGRAIVVNGSGVRFNGMWLDSLDEAKRVALTAPTQVEAG